MPSAASFIPMIFDVDMLSDVLLGAVRRVVASGYESSNLHVRTKVRRVAKVHVFGDA